MRRLWGGAFGASTNDLVEAFGQSIESDLTFWREDVQGSIAHATMLGEAGILTSAEATQIAVGLQQILSEGPERLPRDVEDIHTAVEARLADLIGPVAGKLHTGRSRNDQVATDARLWLKRRLAGLADDIRSLQTVLLEQAKAGQDAVLPGATHQQHAQPVTLAFHLLAHFWLHQRHHSRAASLIESLNQSPLGSAALSGTSFPIDRARTAELLGFDGPSPSALEATSDRSWAMDALHLCVLVMVDLSRLSQEIILWTTPEFGFLKLDDSVTTGSSIMPQKRNPDMAELIRGRTGRVIGHYTALACTMKGLVLGYNRDTQEDKPPLFDSCDLVSASLRLSALMLRTGRFDHARMAAACRGDFSTATDLADHLAGQGMPFREAHETVGRVVRWCQANAVALEDMTEEQMKEAAPGWSGPVPALDPASSASRRESFGGTGRAAVAEQLRLAESALAGG